METCNKCGIEVKNKNYLNEGFCSFCYRKKNILNNIEEKAEGNEMIGIISNKLLNELKPHFFIGKNKINDKELAIVFYYIANRKMNIPIRLEEIADKFRYFDKIESHRLRKLHRLYKKIRRKLGMKTCKTQSIMGTKCIIITSPKTYIELICNKKEISEDIKKECLKVLKKVELKLGSSPPSIAGSIVFVIARKNGLDKRKITQRDIADILGITEVSIRNSIYKLYEILNGK